MYDACRKETDKMLKKIITYIALFVLGFCFLLPFRIMILGSFKDVQFAQLDPLFLDTR